MYENKTFEAIMEEMLDKVPSDVDKREGSVIYDALAPVALELANIYVDLASLIDEIFADSASYYYLVKRAAEHGVFVRAGTAAVLEMVVMPNEVEIDIGTEFNIGELNYTVTHNIGEGHYLLECNETGSAGNNITDEVIPLDYVEGLESAEIDSIYSAGTDEEDEESLRERYYDSFQEVAFGGNKADYKEKIKNMTGVGGCKVYSAKDLNVDAGNVKCVIINNSDYGVPDNTLVNAVQEAIDPTKDGSGVGLAPCGHIVTIAKAGSIEINISAGFTLEATWNDVKDSISEAINEYLLDLRKSWDDTSNLTVRTSRIEMAIMGVEGVIDVENVRINSSTSNHILDRDSIPVLGSVTNG